MRLLRHDPAGDGPLEWVGGVVSPAVHLVDREQPERASVAMWVEIPGGSVVGFELTGPKEARAAVTRSFKNALRAPLAGPPRRPERMRVDDPLIAEQLRSATDHAIPVEVGPTPELGELADSLGKFLDREFAGEESFFQARGIRADDLAAVFDAAYTLSLAEPWKQLADDEVIQVNIPDLEIEEACLSVIGALGESLGFILFPSYPAYLDYLRAAEAARKGEEFSDLGTSWIALTLDEREEVPESMLEEIAEHGWVLPEDGRIPMPDAREPDGAPRPLLRSELRALAACARALSAFFEKLQQVRADGGTATEVHWEDPGGPMTHLMGPIRGEPDEAAGPPADFVDPAELPVLFDPPPLPRHSRNEPCPCGSGRKYKKCHQPADHAHHARMVEVQRWHSLDVHLAHSMHQFAIERFGRGWADAALEVFERGDPEETVEFWLLWIQWHVGVEGMTLAEWYRPRFEHLLSDRTREWMDAQERSWVSLWEALEVEPGKCVVLRDLLSWEVCEIADPRISTGIRKRNCLLARVCTVGDLHVLAGLHPYAVSPSAGADLERRARGRLGRKRAVPVERLRDERFTLYLIRRFEEMLDELRRGAGRPQALHNTDGDPLCWTTDSFAFATEDRARVEAALQKVEDLDPPEEGEKDPHYAFFRETEHADHFTLVGQVVVEDGELFLKTNSIRRGDALRERLESALGTLIRHVDRESVEIDPETFAGELPSREVEDADDPDADAQVLAVKSRLYATWPDRSLPALDGRTPREAVRTADGRRAVDVLLKDVEFQEDLEPPSRRFDVAALRAELGLEAEAGS